MLPFFLAALYEALGEQVGADALLTLPETDSVVTSFRRGYQGAVTENGSGYRRFFRLTEEARVYALARCLAAKLPNEGALLLTKVDIYFTQVGPMVVFLGTRIGGE